MIFVILLASLCNSYANDNTCGGDGVGLSLNPGGEGAMNINLGKCDGEGNGHNTVNVVNVYNKVLFLKFYVAISMGLVTQCPVFFLHSFKLQPNRDLTGPWKCPRVIWSIIH